MKAVLTTLRLRRIAIVIAITIVLAVVYYFCDPNVSGWAPRCMVKTFTGFDCPGCGSQRMIHALLHGDFSGAWQANPFLLCLLPLLIAWLWVEADSSSYPRLSRALNSPTFIIVLLVILIVWTILRNILE